MAINNCAYVRWRTESGRRSVHPQPMLIATCGQVCVWETNLMLQTIAVILLILWILGLVSSYTMGGLIHILLVVAIVIVLVRVIQGRRIL